MSIENIVSVIRDIPDFPKPGIIFKDITPVLKDKDVFAEVIDLLCQSYINNAPDYIVAIESRGFIFGAPMACKLGCGLVLVRKKGKLPYETYEETYELEYGNATVEMHIDSLQKGNRVVVVDDLLATGGTAGAAAKLINKFDAEIIGVDFLMELSFLNGRDTLAGLPVNSLIKVD